MELDIGLTDSIVQHVIQSLDEEYEEIPIVFTLKDEWKEEACKYLHFVGATVLVDLCIEPSESNLSCLKYLVNDNEKRVFQIREIEYALFVCCSTASHAKEESFQFYVNAFRELMNIRELQNVEHYDYQELLRFALSLPREKGSPFIDAIHSSHFYTKTDWIKVVSMVRDLVGYKRYDAALNILKESNYVLKDKKIRNGLLRSIQFNGGEILLIKLQENASKFGLKPSQIAPFIKLKKIQEVH